MLTRPRRRPAPLALLELEARAVPAVFTVTSLLDDATPGTLRAAVGAANASPDPADTINIAVPGTITLSPNFGTLRVTKVNGTLTVNAAAGGTAVTIAGAADRVLRLGTDSPTFGIITDVTLNGLTVTGGRAS